MTARRLASRVAPVQGEAIDSWLEVLAIRMQMSLGAMARHLGLSTEPGPLWRNLLSQKQCDTLAAATGVPPDVLCGMTLSAYDGTALRLDPDSKRPDTTFPFGPPLRGGSGAFGFGRGSSGPSVRQTHGDAALGTRGRGL
ncbi:TniQ family protein [Mycobacterium sp. MUNTM1]